MKKFIVALAAVLTLAGAADAADRRVRVVNNSSQVIERIYGTNVGTQDIGPDRLGSSVLHPGYNVIIDFDDGSGYCEYDLGAVTTSGAIVAKRMNVCVADTWTIYN